MKGGLLMPVTSTPLATPKTKVRPNLVMLPVSLVGVVIGAILWVIGGRFTIDGMITGVNMMLAFLGSPTRYQAGWWAYSQIWFWIPPVFFSVIEQFAPPLVRLNGKWVFKGFWVLLVWAVVSGIDLGSTGLGLFSSPTYVPIITDLAKTMVGLAAMCMVLTFVPERIFRAMLAILVREIQVTWRYAFD